MCFLLAALQLGALPPAESLEVHRAARLAQARFEDFRVEHLPWSAAPAAGRRCDEVVGRFCLRHEPDTGWQAQSESEAIRQARRELLRTLERLQRLAPGDGWITGQRVRYLVEAGAAGAALAAARGCRARRWWCAALLGYARHAAGDYAGAESAFGDAVARLPAAERCRWSDLAPLLEGALRQRYRALRCAERAALERRIWWLADPLYLVPGNERRTEHLARRVLAALQDGARSPYQFAWGADLEELVLRYGWPVAWERTSSRFQSSLPRVVGHQQWPSWDFVPPARVIEDPGRWQRDRWTLAAERAVSRYAPPYARAFHPLPHQVAVFRRGRDSILVVAAYDVRASWQAPGQGRLLDERREERPVRWVQAALVLAPSEAARPVVVQRQGEGPAGSLSAMARAHSQLLSLETLDSAGEVHAARARYWLAVAPWTGEFALSDPLILRADSPGELGPWSAALAPARAMARYRIGERVGVFWEVYGLGDSATALRFELTLAPAGQRWAGWLARWIGWAGGGSRYWRWQWEDPPRPRGPTSAAGRLVVLPSAPGVYRLQVTAALPGGPVARARRTIVVER